MSTSLVEPSATGTAAPAAAVSAAVPAGRRAPDPSGAGGWVLALSSAGVLIVALAYAAARSGHGPAAALYWIGQAVVFLPVAARVLQHRQAGTRESFLLVIGLAVNQYVLKWAYSPDQLRFPDELQHWAATTTLVRSGRLFGANPGLPAAVHFPGLEEMGAAIVSLTGLPVTTAGLIVAGLLHVVFVGVLFMLVRRVGGPPQLAALACLIYATGLHYLFFDAMYLYQTAALPFLALAVWASRAWTGKLRHAWPFALLGVLALAVVTVSHHVTAMVTVGTLALLAGFELVTRRRRLSTPVLAVVGAVLVGTWFTLAAREVFAYLGAPLRGVVTAAVKLLSGGSSGASGAGAGGSSLLSLAVQAAGLLGLLVLFAVAALAALRLRRRRDPWQAALLVGGVLFFGVSGLRFLGAQGPELAGRATTFTYIPMSILAAAVLVRWQRRRPVRRRRVGRLRLAVPVGLALLGILLAGARLGGWPATWELLPGRYLVSGYERSVDPLGVDAAWWTRNHLGTGHRVGADLTGLTLAATYGGQDPVSEVAPLYDATAWGMPEEELLTNLAVDYLWVDHRLTTQVPVSGSLFPYDPKTGKRTSPLTAGQLDKFEDLVGIGRIYDNGTIQIYDMRHV